MLKKVFAAFLNSASNLLKNAAALETLAMHFSN